jgi:hypothetical protein
MIYELINKWKIFFLWYWGLNSVLFFVTGFCFEVESHELFAWAGCELRSSLPLPPVQLGLQM